MAASRRVIVLGRSPSSMSCAKRTDRGIAAARPTSAFVWRDHTATGASACVSRQDRAHSVYLAAPLGSDVPCAAKTCFFFKNGVCV
jgi:hypothetical protein